MKLRLGFLVTNISKLFIYRLRGDLTLPVPIPAKEKKLRKKNFFFQTSLQCLKRFHKDLKGLRKTFSGTTKKCENENLIFISIKPSEMHGTGRLLRKTGRREILNNLLPYRIWKQYWPEQPKDITRDF